MNKSALKPPVSLTISVNARQAKILKTESIQSGLSADELIQNFINSLDTAGGFTRSAVIDHFGSVTAVAEALGITVGAISQWPEQLSHGIQDRILGACTRLGIQVPAEWLTATAKNNKDYNH